MFTQVRQPSGGQVLDADTRTYNALLRSLQHITAGPSKIGDIAKAVLIFTHFAHGGYAR